MINGGPCSLPNCVSLPRFCIVECRLRIGFYVREKSIVRFPLLEAQLEDRTVDSRF